MQRQHREFLVLQSVAGDLAALAEKMKLCASFQFSTTL